MSTLWYMSKTDRNAFTSDPEQAVTVKFRGQISPVLAPGYVNGWAVLAHERQLKLWERLLDAMEAYYEIEEETVARNEGGSLARAMAIAKCDALMEALAILGYGEANEGSLKLIKAQADIRYEQETE